MANIKNSEIYQINIEGNIREIPIKWFFEFLNLEEREYEMTLLGITYKNIPISEFVYALLKYYSDNNKTPNSNEESRRLYELKKMRIVDSEAIETFKETKDALSSQYKINKSLEQELDLVMEKGSTLFHKFFLIYLEVCKRFNYDSKYFLNEKENVLMHQDINYVKDITFDKEVVCYEIIVILAYYLRKLGFNYEIIGEYGVHTLITFRYEEFLIKVEPIETVFKNDLLNVKLERALKGITCYNKNENTKNRFRTILKFYYKEQKINYYEGFLPANKMECDCKLPNEIKDAIRYIDLAIYKIKQQNLGLIDEMAYLTELIDRYKFNTRITCFYNEVVKDNNSITGFSILVILNDIMYGNYYVLYNFSDIKILNQEETQKLFDDGILSDIRNKRYTKGINR